MEPKIDEAVAMVHRKSYPQNWSVWRKSKLYSIWDLFRQTFTRLILILFPVFLVGGWNAQGGWWYLKVMGLVLCGAFAVLQVVEIFNFTLHTLFGTRKDFLLLTPEYILFHEQGYSERLPISGIKELKRYSAYGYNNFCMALEQELEEQLGESVLEPRFMAFDKTLSKSGSKWFSLPNGYGNAELRLQHLAKYTQLPIQPMYADNASQT